MGQKQSAFPALPAGGRMHFDDDDNDGYHSYDAPKYVRGIINEGQNCFVNATLQALATLPPLLSFFCRVKQHQPKEKDLTMDVSSLAGRLHSVLYSLALPLTKRAPPLSIREDILDEFSGYFSALEQHDAQEFFLLLMNTIHENEQAEAVASSAEAALRARFSDALKHMLLSHSSVAAASPSPAAIRHRKVLGLSSLSAAAGGAGSLFRNPFEGQQACSYSCRSCSTKTPWQSEAFLNLSLVVGHHGLSSCSLQTCLRSFFMPEAIHGHQCSKCNSNVGSLKSIRLTRLPSLLCLHLQRRVYTAYGLSKDSRRVTFSKLLDLSDFCKLSKVVPTAAPGETPSLLSLPPVLASADMSAGYSRPIPPRAHSTYHLTAVVRHIGGPDSGHYITYRRVASWLPTDDSGHAIMPTSLHISQSSGSLASAESASIASGSTGDGGHGGAAAAGDSPKSHDTLRVARDSNGADAGSPTPSTPTEPLQWVRVSDTSVEPVDEAEVFECEAYMLYYMRGDLEATDATALTVPSWRPEPTQLWYPL